MIVCGHGDVADFCAAHEMIIVEEYDGDIRNYKGRCRVLVTDIDVSEMEYFYLKSKLMSRGIELVSTRHKDSVVIAEYTRYLEENRKQKKGGRTPYGYYRKDGELVPNPEKMKVVERILELRDSGYVYRQIWEDEQVRHPDGRKLSISTIQYIVKDRGRYE